MNSRSSLSVFLICTSALIACSNHKTNHSGPPSSSAAHADTLVKDSLNELAKIYSLAIADYTKAVNKEYKIQFDTLFFGKHVYGQPDDFPDITLPETIENTPIRLITPEVGSIKQKERKSLVYINLIGFVEPEKAAFIFVNFSNFGEHQYDCYLNYRLNAGQNAFEMEGVRFENFLYKKE